MNLIPWKNNKPVIVQSHEVPPSRDLLVEDWLNAFPEAEVYVAKAAYSGNFYCSVTAKYNSTELRSKGYGKTPREALIAITEAERTIGTGWRERIAGNTA